jgi:hypothetical protein
MIMHKLDIRNITQFDDILLDAKNYSSVTKRIYFFLHYYINK